MAEPLSNGDAYQSVPEAYVFPEHKRPGSSPSSAAAIPVVDLGGDDPDRIVKQIIDAGREFGMFQVINHGVPEQLMREMMSSAEEFFRLPTEEKMTLYSTDSKKLPRFHTSLGYDLELLEGLPQACLRASLEAYTTAVRAVALRLLRLTAAGLGLDEVHFEEGGLITGPMLMNVNHYVPCPDPSLTLGLGSHCDPNIITVLMENGVRGLQTWRRGGGGWVDVEPLPGALVVNFGHQMEVISNGALWSDEHRVVTNTRAARTSLAVFVMPEMGSVVSPAPGLVAGGEAPLYRPYTYQEFLGAFLATAADRDTILAHFQNKD
ncbi:unnamed protein product [Urochloa decumbens]|uniref:Fe2OG dioxygenase domain-containing protein n=1 Tax=Urochloa decumbens TaxID=240449 RepID=A0ABC9E2I9_9POAL